MRSLPAILVTCLILSLVWTPVGAQDDGAPFPPDTVAVGLADSSNTGVTVELSRATFADGGADVVLIGRDDVFADSLASGVAQDEGPLLLVPTAGPVPQGVRDEIGWLGASRAVIFGGENAVSSAVAEELAALGLSVERREGPSRIETAVAVARADAAGSDTAILARAGGVAGNPTSGFADALAAGGWAAATGWPVLLTQTEVLTGSTRDYLVEAGITEVKVMGGTAAISDAVTSELQSMGIGVDRVAGPDRAATAVEVAKDRGADTAADVDHVIVVDGFSEDAWAAGFGAAARSAALDAPIVLGNVDSLPPATTEWLVPGPDALTCALTRSVCEQARLEVGFPASLQTEVPSGAVTFTVTDGSSSAVYAALPDGTPLGLAFSCPTAACTELDWEQTGTHMALLEIGTGVHRLQGQTLSGDVFSGAISFGVTDDTESRALFFFGEGTFVRADFTRNTTSGGSRGGHFTSFQSVNQHPDYEREFQAALSAGDGDELQIVGVPPGSHFDFFPAHVQRRAGAQLLGAAWPLQGTGDIAITDDIGGTGLLRIAPLDGGEVAVDGVDVNSVPYWMPDGETVVVLADTADGVALVAADAATGTSEVLVEDAGDAAGGRIEADPSGTFIAWHAGSVIHVLDTRDGSVATITPPSGQIIAGGPAIRP